MTQVTIAFRNGRNRALRLLGRENEMVMKKDKENEKKSCFQSFKFGNFKKKKKKKTLSFLIFSRFGGGN